RTEKRGTRNRYSGFQDTSGRKTTFLKYNSKILDWIARLAGDHLASIFWLLILCLLTPESACGTPETWFKHCSA
ncbi:MAG: hypothetical protein PVF86_19535, partial [Desulfobacterales bacterium]